MPKEQEYINKIESLDNEEVYSLFEKVLAENTPEWPEGKALEYLVLRAFQLEGADVDWPFSIYPKKSIGKTQYPIEQIDGVIYLEHITCLVECKDKVNKKVDFAPIAKLRNQLLRRPASTIGSIFTTGEFTEPAITLATYTGQQGILLWEVTELKYAIKNQCMCKSMIKKLRELNAKGLPDYNTFTDEI